MIKLDFLSGPLRGETRVYRYAPVRIGRAAGCDLLMEQDTLVSREHAVLEVSGEQVVLRPLKARHPVRVNGHPVAEQAMLEPGDVLTLGETELRYGWVEPPRPVRMRRRSLLEQGAIGIAGLILLGQVLFLAIVAPRWRSHVDVAALRPTPTPTPEPEPEAAATPVPEVEAVQPEAGEGVEEPQGVPTPEPTPLPLPTPTPIPMTETLTVAEQLARAQEMIRARRFLEADRLLTQIQEQAPDEVEAVVVHARLMGRQSRFEESIALWRRVEELAEGGSPAAREAAVEIPLMERRLRQLERPVPTPFPRRELPRPVLPPVPTPVPAVGGAQAPGGRRGEVARNPSLLIKDVAMQRFADQTVADMREIRFTVQHVYGAPAVEAGGARVVARFYEASGREIFPARIPAPEVALRINRALGSGETLRDIKVIYQVPLGARPSGAGSYYGVVLRVFVGDKLAHEAAMPESLLQLSD